MYFDNKVFIIFCQKKELVCVFPFLGKKSLEIKKRLQNVIERTLPYCKSPLSFSNHHLKSPTIFILKMCLVKKSALASLIVLSLIAATISATA